MSFICIIMFALQNLSGGNQAKHVLIETKNIKSLSVKSGVPYEIDYQGWLGAANDTLGITDTLGMAFRLYTASTGGSAVWNEAHIAISVSKGVFNVLLGTDNPIPSSIFSGNPLWLEVQVMTDTLKPRKKLISVGYAIRAENADSAIYADTAGYVLNADELDGQHASAFALTGHTHAHVDSANYAKKADTANYVLSGGEAIKFDIQSNLTEYTQSGDSGWKKVMTFNYTPSNDSAIITEISLLCETKTTSGGGMVIGCVVNASGMGNYTYSSQSFGWVQDSVPKGSSSFTIGATYKKVRSHYPCFFTGESSYTIKFYIETGSMCDTYIKNSTLVIKYLEN
jgi:hypothetical protein